jgi:hypothetical protein
MAWYWLVDLPHISLLFPAPMSSGVWTYPPSTFNLGIGVLACPTSILTSWASMALGGLHRAGGGLQFLLCVGHISTFADSDPFRVDAWMKAA